MNFKNERFNKGNVTNFDPRNLLATEYEKYYRRFKSDSPEQSRTSLARRIRGYILENGIFPPRVLNIGSGPQALEQQLLTQSSSSAKKELKSVDFTSVDLADITPSRLLGKKHENIDHIRADAAVLPFQDKSFGLVVSNHAIDFCPREEAFKEAYRVLNDGGKAIFYLHHPSLLDKSGEKDETTLMFWKYLKDNSILFKSEQEIKVFLESIGFVLTEISLRSDTQMATDTWWEVVAEKPVN